MTSSTARAKQNPKQVKTVCALVYYFFGPEILRFCSKMRKNLIFSKCKKDIEIIIGANLRSILTGTFRRNSRKKY